MNPTQLRRAMQLMGAKGGKHAARNMTAAQRKARAAKASGAAAKARAARKEAHRD